MKLRLKTQIESACGYRDQWKYAVDEVHRTDELEKQVVWAVQWFTGETRVYIYQLFVRQNRSYYERYEPEDRTR